MPEQLLPVWLHWDQYLFEFLGASTVAALFLCAVLVMLGRVLGLKWLVAIGSGLRNLIGSARGGAVVTKPDEKKAVK